MPSPGWVACATYPSGVGESKICSKERLQTHFTDKHLTVCRVFTTDDIFEQHLLVETKSQVHDTHFTHLIIPPTDSENCEEDIALK